eukprot:11788655-Ditylum_brightwellii.AAC.1
MRSASMKKAPYSNGGADMPTTKLWSRRDSQLAIVSNTFSLVLQRPIVVMDVDIFDLLTVGIDPCCCLVKQQVGWEEVEDGHVLVQEGPIFQEWHLLKIHLPDEIAEERSDVGREGEFEQEVSCAAGYLLQNV